MQLLFTVSAALQLTAFAASAAIFGAQLGKSVPNDGQGIDQLGRPQAPMNTHTSVVFQGRTSSSSPDPASTPTTLSTIASTSVSSSTSSPTSTSHSHNGASGGLSSVPTPLILAMVGMAHVALF